MTQHKTNKWSQKVTEHSDALDLKEGIFAEDNSKQIAQSLKQSAEHSDRRKSSPYRSAMLMLTCRVCSYSRDGCAGTELSAEQGAAAPSGWSPAKTLQRSAAFNSVPARRVEVYGSRPCVALLVRRSTPHCVARLAPQAIDFNAIRRVSMNRP
jgi:hypothetical protein